MVLVSKKVKPLNGILSHSRFGSLDSFEHFCVVFAQGLDYFDHPKYGIR